MIEYAGSLVGGRMVAEKMGKDGGKLVVLELAEMDFAGMDGTVVIVCGLGADGSVVIGWNGLATCRVGKCWNGFGDAG